jgi:hypothetical protein
MGSSPTTLTVTQRTLSSRGMPPARQQRARELANSFIVHHGAAHLIHEVFEFLNESALSDLSLSQGIVHLSLPTSRLPLEQIPPPPYGLKGGVARELLVDALSVRNIRQPRDIDIIRKGCFAIPSDDTMAKRYMPQDYQHGARVELVSDMQRYLSTRDITLNEVASFGENGSATLLAALDTIGATIRPSRYRGGSIHRKPTLDGRVLLKMVRLFAEAETHNESSTLVGIPDQISFSEFDLAIHLNKAFQRGESVAEHFIETLVYLGVIEASATPLSKVLADLAHLRHGEKGLLRDVPERFF